VQHSEIDNPRRANKRRSVALNGHKTSVSLEQDYWECLRMVARARNSTVADLIASIDAERVNSNLSSALRLLVLSEAKAGRLGPGPVGLSVDIGRSFPPLQDQATPAEDGSTAVGAGPNAL
jgi:predicted DNA-binding ribbon-helix-helix protein